MDCRMATGVGGVIFKERLGRGAERVSAASPSSEPVPKPSSTSSLLRAGFSAGIGVSGCDGVVDCPPIMTRGAPEGGGGRGKLTGIGGRDGAVGAA